MLICIDTVQDVQIGVEKLKNKDIYQAEIHIRL